MTFQTGKIQILISEQRKKQTAPEDNSSDLDTDSIEVFTASVSFVDTQQMGQWLVDSGIGRGKGGLGG